MDNDKSSFHSIDFTTEASSAPVPRSSCLTVTHLSATPLLLLLRRLRHCCTLLLLLTNFYAQVLKPDLGEVLEAIFGFRRFPKDVDGFLNSVSSTSSIGPKTTASAWCICYSTSLLQSLIMFCFSLFILDLASIHCNKKSRLNGFIISYLSHCEIFDHCLLVLFFCSSALRLY